MNVRILVFAKAPRAGRVKTRLIPALGAEGAARLAARMLDHALDQALAAQVGVVELRASPAIIHPDWGGWTPPAGVEVRDQGSGDLGARMGRAARRVLQGGESVLLMGTDCLEVNARRLIQAATALAGQDAVLYPAADGGYPLLGLRRFDGSLFRDIPWSTAGVAARTFERMAALGWRVARGDVLHDIDEPADLLHLTAAWRVGLVSE